MDQKQLIVAVLHILVIAPFLIYVGYKRDSTPEYAIYLLGALAVIALFMHAPKLLEKYNKTGNIWWVPAIHTVYIVPFLIYIVYKKAQLHHKYFEFLLLFAFAALGYHLYYLLLSTLGVRGYLGASS